MKNNVRNEQGLTLIELLVTIVLFSIIGYMAYYVLINGLNTEKKIRTETLVRDEADLVMSQIVKELYPLTADKLTEVKGSSSSMLQYKNGSTTKAIGFSGDTAYIDGTPLHSADYDLTGSEITLKGSSVQIDLIIKSKKIDKPLNLKSQFGLLGGK
ncbi:type II secretion system protein J [Fictibacillus iocasae]|uniref:Type II secretion system protein J n=1 Tax=Fictibacillus iocasae TaxID=2715437 RepID=A0ABW2NYD1_9BACL